MNKQTRRENSDTLSPKIQPNYVEAERALIGAIITRPYLFDEMGDLHPRMFYNDDYGVLYGILCTMQRSNKPIDAMTVYQEALAQGEAEKHNLHEITSLCNSGIHVSPATSANYAAIIRQKYIQREAIRLGHELIGKSYDDYNDIGDVLQDTGKCVEALQGELIGSSDIKSFYEVSQAAIANINKRIGKYATGEQTGITTGLVDLDRLNNGWQGGELIIIAARPAMGKTAVALHFAKSAAVSDIPVAFFSLEMDDIGLYDRLLLSEANVSPEALKCGNLGNEEVKEIDRATKEICNLPIFIDDNASVTMSHIRAKCRFLHKRGKCRIVIIDYLQLASESGSNGRTREQEITQMSREAKLLAKELNVPVLLLSQLNRSVEKRDDKKPMLSDLRESGSIEQDADMVMFVYRPEYYGIVPDYNGSKLHNYGELIVAKHRNGKVGTVKFKHNDSLTRIFDFDIRGYTNELAPKHHTENNPF